MDVEDAQHHLFQAARPPQKSEGNGLSRVFATHKSAALFLCSSLRNRVLIAKALPTDLLQPHPLCGKAHLSDRQQDGPCCRSSGHQNCGNIQHAVPSISVTVPKHSWFQDRQQAVKNTYLVIVPNRSKICFHQRYHGSLCLLS